MTVPMTTTRTSPKSSMPSEKPVSVGQGPTDPRVGTDADVRAKYGKYSKSGEELCQWVKTQYARSKSARMPYQKRWEFHLMMYGGNQYGELNFNRIAAATDIPAHRIRSVTNLIRPLIRTEMARMTNNKPSATVVPVSGSDDDIFAAQGADAVWESLYSRKKMHALDIRNAFWTSITGNGFRKTYWDRDLVDKTFLTVDPLFSKPTPTKGDLAFSVVTPFNFFVPDLLCEDIEEQPYIIEAYTKPVVWVNTFWKPYLSEPVKANVVGRSELFESTYFSSGNSQEATPDSVLVIEATLKPGAHPDFPQGAMISIVGDQIVQCVETMPYSHGEYPLAQTKHILTGMFYGDSVLSDVIPLQKEYNRTRSQIIESKLRTARPQIMYAEGSIDVKKLTSEPGLAIPYKPGFNPPTPLPAQPIPTYVLDELRTITADIETISGQHQVTKGNGPGSGITAATAISYLQDQDDSLMYTTYASIEQAYEKIARQALSIVVDYWPLPKIIRTIGTDNSFDSIELKGADIANGLDVRVESGSSLPTSKAAQQALLMDLLKLGAITPEQMLDQLNIGGIKNLTELVRIDMDAAKRENLKMKKLEEGDIMMADMEYEMKTQPDEFGNVDPETIDQATGFTLERPPLVMVNEWDNHAIHVEVHNRFRKQQEFELLPESVKKEFATHIRYHQVQMQIDNSRNMEAQAGAQPGMFSPDGGMPPEGGGGEMPGGIPGETPPEMPGEMPGMDPSMEGGM